MSMNLDIVIKPLQFNEEGIAIGSNRYSVQTFSTGEGKDKQYYFTAFMQCFNGDNQWKVDTKQLGLFGKREDAEKVCNEHNRIHILRELLTPSGEKQLVELAKLL